MSSKRAVGRSRVVVQDQHIRARDPRFSSLSGSFNPDLFEKSYSFLSEARTFEIQSLREALENKKKGGSGGLSATERERMQNALKRLESQEEARKAEHRKKEVERGWKAEERKKRNEGKRAWYLKDADKKKLFLEDKFSQLSGDKRKLRKTIEKKQRKIAQREKKAMPPPRLGTAEV